MAYPESENEKRIHPRWEGYAVDESSVVELKAPTEITKDVLTEIIRRGARRLLAEALEAEVDAFIAGFRGVRDENGRQRVERSRFAAGRLPWRRWGKRKPSS